MEISKKTPSVSPHSGNPSGGNGTHDSVQLLEKARAETDTVLKELGSQLDGLSEAEAASRLKQVGTNEIAREAAIGPDAPPTEHHESIGPPAPGAGRTFLSHR